MNSLPKNRLIFQWILPLFLILIIVCSGFSLLLWQHSNYVHFEYQLDSRVKNETGRMAIGALIVSDLNKVKALFYKMITPMSGQKIIQLQEQSLLALAEIQDALTVLDKGGVVLRTLPLNTSMDRETMFPMVYFPEQKTEYNLVVLELHPQLIDLEALVKRVPEIVSNRNRLLTQKDITGIKPQVQHLIRFLQKAEPLFKRMYENANTLSHTSRMTLQTMQKDSDKRRKEHLHEMTIISATALSLIILLMVVIFRNILKTRSFLEEQVAYRTLELTSANSALEEQMQQRTRADTRIRQEKDRWEATFDAIPDIITIQDDDFTILQANEAGHHFFKKEGNLIGKKCYSLFHNGSIPCPGCPNLKIKADGRSHEEIIEHQPLNKWFMVTSSAVVGPEPTPIKYIVHVARDITEQKILERNFLQAQKMESLGRLAGGVAHDFNNILSAINGYSELILLKMQEDSPFREELNIILESGRRASRLTQQLLAFSRKQIIRRVTLNISEEIQESRKMLGRILGEDIEIDFTPNEELWTITGDRSQMEQVLLNLAVNSRDAMGEGGKLSITTNNIIIDAKSSNRHNGLTPGEYVLLSITDTGMGIPDDVLEHIFDPFFTTKEQGKGTGLGLATVHGIVTQHNGTILTKSVAGQGTTFEIYLPRSFGEEKEQLNKMLLTDANQHKNSTILIVEDDDIVRTLLQRTLKGAGYKILAAADGEIGLQLFHQHQQDIDLLLSDMIMPKMGGAELAGILREESPSIKILFISGYTESTLFETETLKQNSNFLHKPITVEKLIQAVHATLSGEFPSTLSQDDAAHISRTPFQGPHT